jgi:hypothetical protein
LLAALRSTLTAAAFRPGLLLSSGFGKFKAGALSFQREHERLTTQHAAIAVKVMARLLEPCLCVVREFSHVLTRPMTIDKPSPSPLAFGVALRGLASHCAEKPSDSDLSFYDFPTPTQTGRFAEQRSSNDQKTTQTASQTTVGGRWPAVRRRVETECYGNRSHL